MLTIGAGLLVFYIVARIAICLGCGFWFAWALAFSIVVAIPLFIWLRNKDLIGEFRDLQISIERNGASRIVELLPLLKDEIMAIEEENNSREIPVAVLNDLNTQIYKLINMYKDKDNGWSRKNRLIYFYHLIQYMDNNDIGLANQIKNSVSFNTLKQELDKCKLQPDSVLLQELRNYESYIQGMGYERLFVAYNKLNDSSLQQSADEIFLDEIRTNIAKRLQRISK